MSDIWCGIPVFNNAGTIGDIVSRCLTQIADVVVIDDGSTDADLRELLKPLKVAVVRHPTNLGKGAALLAAFDFAAERGAKYLITLDGDGQHFPEDIPQFISRVAPDTLLIGSRRQVIGNMPHSSRFGREFSDFWICVESGKVVSDTQSGFRAYPLEAARELRLTSRHYNLEVEVVTRAVWAGLKTAAVPIRVQYAEGHERLSSFRPFLDNARISLIHTRLVLRQLMPIPHHRISSAPAERRTLSDWLHLFVFQNSTPLGLAATVAISALLGILLWPWGVLAVAYIAIRLHLNKLLAAVVVVLCIPKSLAKLCIRIGEPFVRIGSSPGWTRFVVAHVVAFIVAPLAAVLVYAIARRFQPLCARHRRGDRLNIVRIIREETKPFGGRTAIIEGDRSITYAALLDEVSRLGALLLRAGVAPGQRIALRCADGIDYVIGSLSLLECGAAVVPVADSLTQAEVLETIERIDVAGVLTHASLPRLSEEDNAESIGELFRWRSRPSGPQMNERCRDLGAAFIRFSSGTTGESKGVLISHRSVIERTDAANRGLGISDRDVILWVLGMSHHFVVSILLFLRKGATIVVANKSFPFSVLDAVQKHPVNFIYASPVHYYLLACAGSVSPDALRSVRMAISTSMKMPAGISEAFTNKFGIAPAEAYGIIEIGLPFINTEAGPGSRQTVGRILPDYELRIDQADSHGVGAVKIRGKGMFDAYCWPWRLRDECLEDGWFDTGDLGRLDESGRLALLGRSKTVIVCAGMKIFPEEVEEVINSAPGIRESLVSGRDHPQYGQTAVAQIVTAANVKDSNSPDPNSPDPNALDLNAIAESLRAYCLAKLSSYKVPMEFKIVPSLPKTASGKLARAASVNSPATT